MWVSIQNNISNTLINANDIHVINKEKDKGGFFLRFHTQAGKITQVFFVEETLADRALEIIADVLRDEDALVYIRDN